MNILYLLIGCSILLALVFLAAFFWSMNSGQNDDMHTPAVRILFDEEEDTRNERRDTSNERRETSNEKRETSRV